VGIHKDFVLQKKGYKRKNKRGSYDEKESVIIGLLGTGPKVGVTHLCILMANYFCSGCGKKTSVLEWNHHGDFARFGSVCTGMGQKEDFYQIQGVTYYPEADERKLAQCLKDECENIIIDFGVMRGQEPAELLRCHKAFLVVSFSEWQEGAFGNQNVWKERAIQNSWQCLAAFGSEESRIQWNKRYRPTVLRIPLSVDAFTLTKELMDWMKRLEG
jgi:hypothetical protein